MASISSATHAPTTTLYSRPRYTSADATVAFYAWQPRQRGIQRHLNPQCLWAGAQHISLVFELKVSVAISASLVTEPGCRLFGRRCCAYHIVLLPRPSGAASTAAHCSWLLVKSLRGQPALLRLGVLLVLQKHYVLLPPLWAAGLLHDTSTALAGGPRVPVRRRRASGSGLDLQVLDIYGPQPIKPLSHNYLEGNGPPLTCQHSSRGQWQGKAAA